MARRPTPARTALVLSTAAFAALPALAFAADDGGTPRDPSPSSASSRFGPASGAVTRTPSGGRFAGSTLLPRTRPGDSAGAVRRRYTVSRSRLGKKTVTKLQCVPKLGSGTPCTAITLEGFASYARWNDRPTRGKAILDVDALATIKGSVLDKTLNFGGILNMKYINRGGRKRGFGICKGDVNWDRLCTLSFSFPDLLLGPDTTGSVYPFKKTGCVEEGKIRRLRCPGATYEVTGTDGPQVRGTTRVSRVEIRFQTTKDGLPGQSITAKIPFFTLKPPKTVPAPRSASKVARRTATFPWADRPEAEQRAALARVAAGWDPVVRSVAVTRGAAGATSAPEQLVVAGVSSAGADGCRGVTYDLSGLTGLPARATFRFCAGDDGAVDVTPADAAARRVLERPAGAVARGQTVSALAYVATPSSRRALDVIVAGDDEQADALPAAAGGPAIARGIGLSGGERQSRIVTVRRSGAGAPRVATWADGRRAAAPRVLPAGCRVRLTWTATHRLASQAALLRTTPDAVDVDAAQCAASARP